MGMRWFFNDLQFLSAMSGGSGSTLLIRSFGLITSLCSSATHCLSGGLQGLCVTTMGGRLWPSLTLYVNVSLLGVTRAFFRGLFQGFYVIASREQGGLDFLGTFLNVSGSEQSRRTLRNWLDGMFLYTCGGWQDRQCRYPCASVALVWRSVWR